MKYRTVNNHRAKPCASLYFFEKFCYNYYRKVKKEVECMEYRIARSYEDQGYKIMKVYEQNGKLYADCKCACDRCGGAGQIPYFGHIDQGICFACGGAKYFYKTVRAYTEAEREKMDAAAKAKEEKKNAQAQADSEVNKIAWMKKYGMDGGKLFIVAGTNTYHIKDDLKAAGARYYDGIGWFFNEQTVPKGYIANTPAFLYPIAFDDLFQWNCFSKKAFYKENALNQLQADIKAVTNAKNAAENKSEFYGTIGERIRKERATFVSQRYFENDWGGKFIYTFKIGDNVFTWFTQSTLADEIQPGDEVELSGTVKDHKEYNGVNQTVLSRCIVKEVK